MNRCSKIVRGLRYGKLNCTDENKIGSTCHFESDFPEKITDFNQKCIKNEKGLLVWVDAPITPPAGSSNLIPPGDLTDPGSIEAPGELTDNTGEVLLQFMAFTLFYASNLIDAFYTRVGHIFSTGSHGSTEFGVKVVVYSYTKVFHKYSFELMTLSQWRHNQFLEN